MSKNREKLLIIDGNALIHRSFHALPPTMKTKDGVLTNAVFGFTSFLLKALKEFKPEYVVLTLDRKAPTFRHQKFAEYKATRVKAPDELYQQIPLVKKIANTLNIPVYEMDGYEADDIIGTIANLKLQNENLINLEKIIITGDADTLQLVNEDTKVFSMSRGIADSVLYDVKAVEEKYDLRVEQLIDYKALRGDPSDNIPGVKGVGEKTAVELLKQFETLENLYHCLENAESSQGENCLPEVDQPRAEKLKIKERIGGLLLQHKEEAFLSKELATIHRSVPIEFDIEKARFGGFDKNEVVGLFGELEFKSLLPRLGEITNNQITITNNKEDFVDKFERDRAQFDYQLINPSTSSGQEKFEKFLKELKKQKEFVFDTETTSLDPLSCEILGIGFCWQEGRAYFVRTQNSKLKTQNFGNNLFNYNQVISCELQVINDWLTQLKPIFEDKNVAKLGHNLKYDVRVLQAHGVEVKNIAFDSMIASYLLNPGNRQHGLDACVFSEFGFEKINTGDLLGKGKERKEFNQVDINDLAIYCGEDADFTWRLVNKFRAQLKNDNLEKLFAKIEMPLLPVLAEMENNGVMVDVAFLKEMEKALDEKIKELEEKIFFLADLNFNVRSTQQLKKVLFEDLQISTEGVSRIKTGFSTSAEDLEKLRDRHPIVPLIIEHRELSKLQSTYVTALPELVNKKTGRVHTSYNQTVAATGRLSSTDPNLQNIPIRTELGREIRKAFIARPGFKLMALDYSQIELRIAAHLSGDETMIAAFKNQADIHTETAAKIKGIEPSEVTKEMRRDAKAINFGILYGQGAHGLSQATGITFVEARDFIEQYFKVFAGVKKYIDETITKTRELGYVETFFGRRRYLPEINSTIPLVKKAAERMAVNTPIQGTAADIIKIAMIRVLDEIKNNQEIKMLLQVHDELVFEVKDGNEKKYFELIKRIMEDVVKIRVPIIAEGKVGKSWGEIKSV